MTIRLPAFLFFACALAMVGTGKADTTSDTEPLRYYNVEVVIFKNIKVPKNKEYILPVSSPLKVQPILELASLQSVEQARAFSYEIPGYEELKLLDTVSKINDSSRYELLVHTAWRQPGREKQKTLPIWITGGRLFGNEYTSIDNRMGMAARAPKVAEFSDGIVILDQVDEVDTTATREDRLEVTTGAINNSVEVGQPAKGLYELEGTITVALSRYLHTYADLVLRRPRLLFDPPGEDASADQFVATNNPDARILNNHSLKEHRRMRSNTLHYLDNPEFSMLVLITPFDKGTTESPALVETEQDAELEDESATTSQ